MGLFIFISAIVIIFVMLWVCLLEPEEMAIGVMLILAIFFVLFVIPYQTHVEDLSVIANQERIIDIQEKRIERISERLNNVEDKGEAMWNADTPVATMMQSLVEAENKITEAKEKVLESEMRIQKRKVGVTSYILWFAPETIEG